MPSSSLDTSVATTTVPTSTLVVIEPDESQPLREQALLGLEDVKRTVSSPGSSLLGTEAEKAIARALKVPPSGKCWVETLLVRPVSDTNNDPNCTASFTVNDASATPGLVACHLLPSSSGGESGMESPISELPNVRATRLAMACGLLSIRFYGTVVLHRTASAPAEARDLAVSDVERACCVSPDLRNDSIGGSVPEWLARAAQHNYHDQEVIQRLARAMSRPEENEDSQSSDGDHDDDSGEADGDRDNLGEETDFENDAIHIIKFHRSDECPSTVVELMSTVSGSPQHEVPAKKRQASFVARTPLCLACRRPSSNLCSGCRGAYFCSPSSGGAMGGDSAPLMAPSSCQVRGWSHKCWCKTWKRYVARRCDLSTFPFLGSWVDKMTGRDCQLSQSAYEDRLTVLLGISLTLFEDKGPMLGLTEADAASSAESQSAMQDPNLAWRRSWWKAEYGAWDGGGSVRACQIDVSVRVLYVDGFYPLPAEMQPLAKPIDCADLARVSKTVTRNALGLVRLQSWGDYYELRDIPSSSPVALLLSFPLTLYHAIVEYGEVPSTVAHGILRRDLRIHIVGAEKELFFLDMFRETSFLLGSDTSVSTQMRLELVFVVRGDMVPPSMRASVARNDCTLYLSETLTVRLVSGTYGDPNSLDPNFDCGSGPPDMIVAFNAGLYAYESWRSVVSYLDRHRSVVGVFTDYNEMSAVQCAGLGGPLSRESVTVNPFRQPRAMPVYSMNLPQFSNGFYYVYNQQTLE